MSHNTIAINQTRQDLTSYDEIWLFGYGSLIHKVDFPYIAKAFSSIAGWERRFWQGSHDHRGTPKSPGRVVTLIPSEGSTCFGMSYQVTHDVFEHLDHREKNGYLRFEVNIEFEDGEVKAGLVYIAAEDNAAYLGPASEQAIAEHIHNCRGPSGENKEYLLDLAVALRSLEVDDLHVFAVEAALKEMGLQNE
ncbi:MAG: gamma-glutamylcyclotransferase [Algicola sp.]|nr:gamma-glutamylcyclotransferase [Algicola sp.]